MAILITRTIYQRHANKLKPQISGFQADFDADISPLGEHQADERRRRLGNPILGRVGSSPLKRAKRTAARTGGVNESAVIILPALGIYDPAVGGCDRRLDDLFNEHGYKTARFYVEKDETAMMEYANRASADLQAFLAAAKDGERDLVTFHAVCGPLAVYVGAHKNQRVADVLLDLNLNEAGCCEVIYYDGVPQDIQVMNEEIKMAA